METQYYIPEIGEFHVGFEYESLNNFKNWYSTIFGDSNGEFNNELSEIYVGLKRNMIRVKHLDIEDIENIGFIKRLKNEWIGWNDYKADILNPEYGYFMRVTLHVPRPLKPKEQFKIYVHRYLISEDAKIEEQLKQGESELVYKGLIKNKSELVKLLKQLGIWQ